MRLHNIKLCLIQTLGEPGLCELIAFFLKEKEHKDALDYHHHMWENLASRYYNSVESYRTNFKYFVNYGRIYEDYFYLETNVPYLTRRHVLDLVTIKDKEYREKKDSVSAKLSEGFLKQNKEYYS